MSQKASSLYATAALGTADLVAGELKALGFQKVRWDAGGASFDAAGDPIGAGMRACLGLRAALRVLWPLADFAAPDADALYEGARAATWEEVVTPDTTFAIHARTSAPPPLAHAPYLAQRVKDAIVDRMRERTGARPSVARADPDVRAYAHVADGRATVGLDVSGDSLHLRGYRTVTGPAPLRETLAAAVLLATGWRGDRPLVDPMCGSGTIAIEAALLALDVAPGLVRPAFGFQRWPRFAAAERSAWKALLDEARARVRPRLEVPILGSDRDPEATAAARANAARLPPPVRDAITWDIADARALAPTLPPGVIVSNPPYGERIGGEGSRAFWRTLGQRLRTLDGHTAFLLCHAEMLRALAMRPTWQRRLMNGPLPVVLARFELGRQRARVRP
jgi:putative N6-adenine-specific DNA methylase